MVRIGKLVVIGVGLIGGSFALAMKRSGGAESVVGVGRGRSNIEAAHRLGISKYLIGELLWCLALLLCLAILVVDEVTVQLRQPNPYGGIRPLRVGRDAHPVAASLLYHHQGAVF